MSTAYFSLKHLSPYGGYGIYEAAIVARLGCIWPDITGLLFRSHLFLTHPQRCAIASALYFIQNPLQTNFTSSRLKAFLFFIKSYQPGKTHLLAWVSLIAGHCCPSIIYSSSNLWTRRRQVVNHHA